MKPKGNSHLNRSVYKAPGVSVTAHSANRKLTHDLEECPVHTTTVTFDSCPTDCPFYRGCYAKAGPMGMKSWRVTHSSEATFDPIQVAIEEARGISLLPAYGLLRVHDSGETLLPEASRIVATAVREWKEKCDPLDKKSGRNIWFTRATETKRADYEGVSIIRSCQTTDEIKAAHRAGMPAAVVIDTESKAGSQIIGGEKFILCPQQLNPEKMDCFRCGMCANSDRMVDLGINVGFLGHGVSKRFVNMQALRNVV